MLTTAYSLLSYLANLLILYKHLLISTFSRQYSKRETKVSHDIAKTLRLIISISFLVLSRYTVSLSFNYLDFV